MFFVCINFYIIRLQCYDIIVIVSVIIIDCTYILFTVARYQVLSTVLCFVM